MDKIKTYNKLNKSPFKSDDLKINTHVPSITDFDYDRGYIRRYFIRKINDLNSFVFEVSKKQSVTYNQNPLYIVASLNWRISGSLDEIQNSNRKSLNLASKEISNIRLYLPNLLQFSKS